MSITRFRPVRYQPVRFSALNVAAMRPDPLYGILDDLFTNVPARPHKPTVRVEPSDDSVTVQADLPGVRREDLQVTATPDGDGALVTLSAVRHIDGGDQQFRWSAHLADVAAESVTATLSDGVLNVHGTRMPGPVARTVEVTVTDPEPAPTAIDAATDTTAGVVAETPEETRET